jgi:plastocyanin
MAFTWRININPNPGGPATFEFDDQPPPTVQVGDQIIWSNEDVQPHFPHPNAVGTFMPNQIAAHSTSPAFALSTPGTIKYHCCLHPHETGTIEVKVSSSS